MMDTFFFTSIADEISDRGWLLPWEGFPPARGRAYGKDQAWEVDISVARPMAGRPGDQPAGEVRR